ncbi:hypothetical protein Hanom_Chr03g00204331 [Helianthus anomalus]
MYIIILRVNCHFGPCGLGTFAILVQISNFLHLGPCGLHFVAILVQNPYFFNCCNLLFCLLVQGHFGHFSFHLTFS